MTCVTYIYSHMKGLSDTSHTHTHTQSSKRDDKRNGELIPAMPFFMTPTRISYFMREKLGVTKILKAARKPTIPIDLKDITRPSSNLMIDSKPVEAQRHCLDEHIR